MPAMEKAASLPGNQQRDSESLCAQATSIGLLAGGLSLPLIFARLARAQGVQRIVAVGFKGETDPSLEEFVDELIWVNVGQLKTLIRSLTSRGIKQCVMAGRIAPKSLFDVRPDLRALTLLLTLKERNAHSIFTALAGELKREGVELISATPWLKPIMPGADYLAGPKLTAEQQEDTAYGYQVAKEISRLEIGQTVVVKKGTVLAVEGFEGTDACLRRGGELAGKSGGAVAVKVAKENHDFRFDIPCVGPRTIDTCSASRVAVLAFEAGRTLLLEREQIEAAAVRRGVSLTSVC
jgi:UDP-2,3-diacylglucosamine hydrolase